MRYKSNNKHETRLVYPAKEKEGGLAWICLSTMVSVWKRRTIALLLLLARLRRRNGGRRRSLHWVHSPDRRRRRQGDFYHLVAELRLDSRRHQRYFQMRAEQMDELLSLIGHELSRQSASHRAAVQPKQRLAVALRYLASGDSLHSLAFNYHLTRTTVTDSVHMVCAAIEKQMSEKFLPRPTLDTWREVAQRFWEKWNFPNCLGALDGKHVVIHYGNTFTVQLLALVDADYRFRCVQVGDFGRASDGGVYSGSDLGRGMVNKTQHVPPSASLPGAAHLGDVPYAMVADTPFPLKPYLMRPYPGQNLSHKNKIFNYRLKRARLVVENAFGILASRWRIFHRRINLDPENVYTLVMAACILHNFLLDPNENVRLLEEAEEVGRHMAPVRNTGGNVASVEACAVRERFATFFTSPEGIVSWQDKMV